MAHIDLDKKILDKSERFAQENRELLDAHGVFMIDLLASPGAGKTSTIKATINALRERYSIAIIEGDIASNVDAVRIKEMGIPAVQINTGGSCHLEGDMINKALKVLDLANLDLIIIENVGNLVCPTDFYLGEDVKVMILSVPEGDDKPLKYPGIFQAAKAIILNKVDTLPVFDFDMPAFEERILNLNPQAPLFKIAATKENGVDSWSAWLTEQIEAAKAKQA
ncbi:MAG: hydrogenase nickel incorporation protein HypB [Coriobacteriaceae bacterium]|nr:hydrogenase nickel incorporation protein HypB [Coriobacteriaceae bacterium]MDD6769210.1 hydrogenase nickel incorporation protein HypB [Coriobacteriaceae bacterium]